MVKKALCVGCNYPSKAFGLAGSVNDAFLIADVLQNHCGFEPENVCVLHDVYPGQKKSTKVDPGKTPSRVNILHRLQWLVRGARPGDVLFFSFSGYGLQVDDMDGYQDEGYDEAILPTDFVDGRDGDYTVIVAGDIHDILTGVPQNCAVTVLMDCDHASSIIDVSGTVDGTLVGGLKYHNFCGLRAHTVKMQLASHNRDVWQEERARAAKARPRFQPMMEIDNPRKGRLPTRPAMSRSSPVAFCYSASGHGQTAMEMQVTTIVDGKETPKQHGILSWCFAQGLGELRYECTYIDLLQAIRRQMTSIKEKDHPRMDQEVLLTFCTPLSDPMLMRALQPVENSGCSGASPGAGEMVLKQMPVAAPPVVPPPPRGFINSQGAGAAGGGASGTGGTAAVSREEPGMDHMPPLPPPPPPPAPVAAAAAADRRSASELVHHNVLATGQGGSFTVHGASYAPPQGFGGHPPQLPLSKAAREPSREMIGKDRMFATPQAADMGRRQYSEDYNEQGHHAVAAAQVPTGPPPWLASPGTAPGGLAPPGMLPGFKGLTPPNLFAGPAPMPLSFGQAGIGGSFGQVGPGPPSFHGPPLAAAAPAGGFRLR